MTGTDDSRPAAMSQLRPRIRTAAIVWGLVVAALALAVAWFALDPERVTSVGLAVLAGEPPKLAIIGVALLLAVGVVIVIGSLLSVVHRAQDRGRTRREERAAASTAPERPTVDGT